MASKTLTAKVRFDTKSAESALKRLDKQINKINKAVNKTKATNLEKQLSRCGTQATKLRTNIGKVNSALSKTSSTASKVKTNLNQASSKTKQWSNSQKQVNSNLRTTNGLLGSVGSRLRGILATYLGIQAMKTGVATSDTMTGAQNKLNYISAQKLGKQGTNANGSYSSSTYNATQDAMDKMYVSSQKVRMSYTDMMSNVSKSMVLAGDAFDNSTDNAIRFQEIMAEAYAVGGASAQEMSTSMYQMIQALGAGTLAGDELRSVREGAPMAYKAIEEFVQGVYDTEESLKDLASQGKVTSDMVVASIMNSGSEMDKAFAQTKQTFAQTWEQIKNMAKRAFLPVSNMLQDALQKAVNSGAIKKLEKAFTDVSKVMQITFKIVINLFTWIADNWGEIRNILISVATTLGVLFAAEKIINFIWWLQMGGGWIIFFAIAIYSLVKPITDVLTGVKTLSKAIEEHFYLVGIGLLILGALLGSWWVALAGVIVFVLGIAMRFFEQVCGGAWVVFTFLGNLIQDLLNIFSIAVRFLLWLVVNLCAIILNVIFGLINEIISIVLWLGAMIWNAGVGLVNSLLQLASSIVEPIISIVEWILNVCNGGFDSFGDAVANLIGQIIGWFLSLGSVVTKIIDAIFGTNWTKGLNSLKDKVTAWGKNNDAITLEKEMSWEAKRIDATNAFNKGQLLPEDLGLGWSFVEEGGSAAGVGFADWNPKQAYSDGSKWGSNARDKLDSWGNKASEWFDDKVNLDNIGEKLGLDFKDIWGSDSLFPKDLTLDPYKMPSNDDLLKGIDDISDDTSKIADSMELADDDLEFLRKLADMEWRKEFTTAEIKVDMTNHNTVNGERDLDGIVSYLSDVLREEMTSVAYGVHY